MRTIAATTGAAWGGLAYAARDGNPYVMAVFAALYMFPASEYLSSPMCLSDRYLSPQSSDLQLAPILAQV